MVMESIDIITILGSFFFDIDTGNCSIPWWRLLPVFATREGFPIDCRLFSISFRELQLLPVAAPTHQDVTDYMNRAPDALTWELCQWNRFHHLSEKLTWLEVRSLFSLTVGYRKHKRGERSEVDAVMLMHLKTYVIYFMHVIITLFFWFYLWAYKIWIPLSLN